MRDWYDDYIEEGEDMNVYLISDTHFNHDKEGGVMQTYCLRPADFTQQVIKNWQRTVKPTDVVFHLGDVMIGKKNDEIMKTLPGRKILIRGNHDRSQSCTWWMEKGGFDFACDSFVFRHVLLTHEPANAVIKSDGHRPYGALEEGLPEGCMLNVHGHLHNIWDGFHKPERLERDKELLGIDPTKQLKHSWQRLFALEYTGYAPVEFNKFVSHPEKYQATGPRPNVP